MNIIVCIKQVPDSTQVKVDPKTGTLIRAGVPSILNPYDHYALEKALAIKAKTGAKVTVLSMGPQQATAVLRLALALGADEGVLLSAAPLPVLILGRRLMRLLWRCAISASMI